MIPGRPFGSLFKARLLQVAQLLAEIANCVLELAYVWTMIASAVKALQVRLWNWPAL